MIKAQGLRRDNTQADGCRVPETDDKERCIQNCCLPSPCTRSEHDILPLEYLLRQLDLPALKVPIPELLGNLGEN